MKKPEIPDDEALRLRALRALDILDTPAEERFDRLTRIAQRLFGVPIILVSLIDENRQWFKSKVGLALTETPRDVSFCGHAILGDDILVVHDATTDQRFTDNPLVLGEPNIRFYAGCPLKSLDGSKLGTMCLIDSEPRGFEQDDQAALRDLAAMVEREIELTQLVTIDELTDIPNRRGFQVLAENSLNLCLRKDLPASIVYLDIDKFKEINDTYGHAEGDRALSVFANNMKRISRDSDVFARLGGDEFVILLADSDRESAELTMTRFAEELDALGKLENLEYKIHFSCGIMEFNPDVHSSVTELLTDADKHMYAQKHARAPNSETTVAGT